MKLRFISLTEARYKKKNLSQIEDKDLVIFIKD